MVREAYPDPAQFDKSSNYYDARSSREAPTWVAVDVKLVREGGGQGLRWSRGTTPPEAQPPSPAGSETQVSPLIAAAALLQVRKLGRQVALEELRSHSGGGLAGMALFKYGRLSVQPVTAAEWAFVLGLEGAA